MNIKLIVLDVDGTLTDGKITIDSNGVEYKNFNVKDGFAIVQAKKNGIKFGIITGRESKIVEFRAKELGIEDVYQGVDNKAEKLDEIIKKYNIDYSNVAYIGDDINDLNVISKVGFSAAPKDSAEEIKSRVDYISSFKGGKGAVRDIIEYVLKIEGIWNDVLNSF